MYDLPHSDLHYASITSRAIAFAIDVIFAKLLINRAGVAFTAIAGVHTIRSGSFGTGADLAFNLAWIQLAISCAVTILYFGLCDGILCDATIGKSLMHIIVVSANGHALSLTDVLIRSIAKVFFYYTGSAMILATVQSSASHPNTESATGSYFALAMYGACLIGYLIAMFTSHRQAVHDIAAGSVVIVAT